MAGGFKFGAVVVGLKKRSRSKENLLLDWGRWRFKAVSRLDNNSKSVRNGCPGIYFSRHQNCRNFLHEITKTDGKMKTIFHFSKQINSLGIRLKYGMEHAFV